MEVEFVPDRPRKTSGVMTSGGLRFEAREIYVYATQPLTLASSWQWVPFVRWVPFDPTECAS